MSHKIEIEFEAKGLDTIIEKANRLVQLLREAEQIVNSLSGKGTSEAIKKFTKLVETHLEEELKNRTPL